MTSPYQIIERAPTLDEYKQITFAVGWEDLTNFEAVETALNNSAYHVIVLYQNQIVGMARIIGDGAMFYFIQDVAVNPSHQGKGVGRLMMDHVMAYLKNHAPRQAFIGLFATEGHVEFYRHYGFEIASPMTGMLQWKNT
jgi:ribosomal protein S18 acetylase RimI-like enzyme